MPYFRDLRDKDSVEWVAMDMYHVYRQVVRATLPQARIVVDRFHIGFYPDSADGLIKA
jgi:transposase